MDWEASPPLSKRLEKTAVWFDISEHYHMLSSIDTGVFQPRIPVSVTGLGTNGIRQGKQRRLESACRTWRDTVMELWRWQIMFLMEINALSIVMQPSDAHESPVVVPPKLKSCYSNVHSLSCCRGWMQAQLQTNKPAAIIRNIVTFVLNVESSSWNICNKSAAGEKYR